MIYIAIALAFGVLSAIVRKAEASRDAREAARAAQLRREMEEARVKQREEEARVIAMEKEQLRLAREQERQRREQERQAATLAKHEKRLLVLENSIETAQYTISTQNERINELDAQLDRLLLLQAGTVPGGKEHTKLEEKIATKRNQIRVAEGKILKAKQIIKTAKKEMEVA